METLGYGYERLKLYLLLFRQMLLWTTTSMLVSQLMQKRTERTTSLTLGSVQELGDAKPASRGFRERVTSLLETVWQVRHSNVNTARRQSASFTKFFSAEIVPPNSQSKMIEMKMMIMTLNKLITFLENGFILMAMTQNKKILSVKNSFISVVCT